MDFELYSSEELDLVKMLDLLLITNETSLVYALSDIYKIKVNLEFRNKLYFEDFNKKFMAIVNEKGFNKQFSEIIKNTYFEPYKTGLLKVKNPQGAISDFFTQLRKHRKELAEYRFQNKIRTRTDYDFQKLINLITDEFNLLESYLVLNKMTPKKDVGEKLNKDEVNPHPDLFKETKTFYQFKEYTEKYIKNSYIDFSYLFSRLKEEGLIHNFTAKELFEWLESNGFITSDEANKFYKEEKFRTLDKSQSKDRISYFNATFLTTSQKGK